LTVDHPSFLSGIGYSSGNFGKNLMSGSMDILFMFLATELLGLSPFVAGVILLSSMVLDAILDPFVGVVLDRASGPLVNPIALIVIGAPLTGLTFSFVLHLPLLEWDTPWSVLIALMLFRGAYSIIDLPHNTLLTTKIPHGSVRARIATYRFAFSSLATLVLALALRPMVESTESGTGLSSQMVADLSIWMGLGAAFVISISAFSLAGTSRDSTLQPVIRHYQIRRTLLLILRSPQCSRAILAGTLCAFGLPLFSKSLIFLADLVLGDIGEAPDLLLAMVIGQFVGLLFWLSLAKRHRTTTLLRSAYFLSAVALFASSYAVQWGAPAMLALSAAVGIGASGSYALIWAVLSDAAEGLRDETGVSAGGTLFGIAVLLQKGSIGMSGLVLGAGLEVARSLTHFEGYVFVVACTCVVPALALAAAALVLRTWPERVNKLAQADTFATVERRL
jgi:glycoside/pentoside/hexuronide:cation symporter, GPH family